MKPSTDIATLFADVGGVLLTDGWRHGSRTMAAKTFGLNPDEMESRHDQALGAYELGKLVALYEHSVFTL